jgi:hypothetical protein
VRPVFSTYQTTAGNIIDENKNQSASDIFDGMFPKSEYQTILRRLDGTNRNGFEITFDKKCRLSKSRRSMDIAISVKNP